MATREEAVVARKARRHSVDSVSLADAEDAAMAEALEGLRRVEGLRAAAARRRAVRVAEAKRVAAKVEYLKAAVGERDVELEELRLEHEAAAASTRGAATRALLAAQRNLAAVRARGASEVDAARADHAEEMESEKLAHDQALDAARGDAAGKASERRAGDASSAAALATLRAENQRRVAAVEASWRADTEASEAAAREAAEQHERAAAASEAAAREAAEQRAENQRRVAAVEASWRADAAASEAAAREAAEQHERAAAASEAAAREASEQHERAAAASEAAARETAEQHGRACSLLRADAEAVQLRLDRMATALAEAQEDYEVLEATKNKADAAAAALRARGTKLHARFSALADVEAAARDDAERADVEAREADERRAQAEHDGRKHEAAAAAAASQLSLSLAAANARQLRLERELKERETVHAVQLGDRDRATAALQAELGGLTSTLQNLVAAKLKLATKQEALLQKLADLKAGGAAAAAADDDAVDGDETPKLPGGFAPVPCASPAAARNDDDASGVAVAVHLEAAPPHVSPMSPSRVLEERAPPRDEAPRPEPRPEAAAPTVNRPFEKRAPPRPEPRLEAAAPTVDRLALPEDRPLPHLPLLSTASAAPDSPATATLDGDARDALDGDVASIREFYRDYDAARSASPSSPGVDAACGPGPAKRSAKRPAEGAQRRPAPPTLQRDSPYAPYLAPHVTVRMPRTASPRSPRAAAVPGYERSTVLKSEPSKASHPKAPRKPALPKASPSKVISLTKAVSSKVISLTKAASRKVISPKAVSPNSPRPARPGSAPARRIAKRATFKDKFRSLAAPHPRTRTSSLPSRVSKDTETLASEETPASEESFHWRNWHDRRPFPPAAANGEHPLPPHRAGKTGKVQGLTADKAFGMSVVDWGAPQFYKNAN
ncbi:hypothetical protein M885DRAFT_547820 [Pelagophyceae sp. CCMP2097]|nr:hypothetical protein M885DRAFT_547820 [Pelagophyceae sp. CCMP2097]